MILEQRTAGSAVFVSTGRRAFLAALGIVAGLGFAGLANVQAQDSQGVVFCGYNLKNWLSMPRIVRGAQEGVITKPEKEKARVVEFLKSLRPDVLGVCEIGTREDLADLQTRLKAAGLDLPHTEWAHGGDTTRSLALLSRFPITGRQSQTSLSYTLQGKTLPLQRGILDVTVDVAPGFPVRFLGVHLKSKRVVDDGDEAAMRLEEARLLRRHLDGIFAQEANARVVCYGDFNEHRHEAPIATIIGKRGTPSHMEDVYLHDLSGLVWTHFWDTADVYSRFDYIFTSPALRPFTDTSRSFIYSSRDFAQASDHRPVILTLTPPTTGGGRAGSSAE